MPKAPSLVVAKVGSSTLVDEHGALDRAFIRSLCDQVVELAHEGTHVVLVSSGAAAAGRDELGLAERPSDIMTLQACAAAGQAKLTEAYADVLAERGIPCGQVLLTRRDVVDREEYLNARNTLMRLIELGAMPVVNENDTVSVAEFAFGDNDMLGAIVAGLVSADLYVILSDVDGLYTANPSIDPDARFIPRVEKIDATIIGSAGDSSTSVGTGGMITKIRASRILMTAGIESVICSGSEPDALVRIARGESVGTLFAPPVKHLDIAPRKLWIALGDQAHGSVTVDDGAAHALTDNGSSLLAVGIRGVQGPFAAGDILDVKDASGMVVARGIAEADSDTLELAAGRREEEIESNRLLAQLAGKPAIHRDNLIVFA